MRQSRNVNREASLELSLSAVKSLVSDYAMRARHAEEAAQRLQGTTEWTEEQIKSFGQMVATHMDQRSLERSVQQQAIIQATVVALGLALQAEADERQGMLTNMLRDLTSAVQHMKPQPRPSSK